MTRFYRSETNKKLGGVCGGLGEIFDVDPVALRILFVIAFFVTGFFPIGLGYILAWWLFPKKSQVHPQFHPIP